MLGEALLRPLRAGTLRVVNAFGAGVADDKLTYAHVEDLVRLHLGEEPLLPSARTFDLTRESDRAEASNRLDELVLKPRTGSGGYGVLIGSRATRTQLEQARALLRAAPEGWVAQELLAISTHPTLVDGRLEPRHLDLRPFVSWDGHETRVLPGGISRFARAAGDLVVNSSQGGGGKDTWVLDGEQPRS